MSPTPIRLTRRSLLLAASGVFPGTAESASEPAFCFETDGYIIRVTLEFHDGYRSQGFTFQDRRAGRRFCLSATGNENRECLEGFVGSIAIAHYRLQSQHGLTVPASSLRELVRDIDRSASVSPREPYERAIAFRRGLASDIQAFGYTATAEKVSPPAAGSSDVWWLARQDLFLGDALHPFLTAHWKHRLDSIRILDVIPGPRTRQLFKSQKETQE